MDKVTIFSRRRFEEFVDIPVPKEDVVAIRIGDTKAVRDSVSKRYYDTLSLAFSDKSIYEEELDRTKGEGSTHITETDKAEIDAFVEQYKDKHFVVHCEHGINRSPAVGYYILKKLGYEEELAEKKASALYQPSIEVYGMLIGKHYTKENDQALRNELKNIEL
ncbi:hypothetical protein [Weissella cibaria]|uniref:hypothetical protein n=1 Tax=Weissella cibaria TaxID=137591 RepID=UPI00215B4E92|nr:hypothetical protein [Weissella cibaria]MCR8702165.1 hypothetical protein [Weissella cibaria]